ncbi:MAG: insulinase family protein [Spirochaetales bacterium]|nr:insulinase family protein [Spirochaetales bacterium]
MKYASIVLIIFLFISGCVSAPQDGKSDKLLYQLEEKLTSPAVSVPVISEEVLENGLRLVLMQRNDLPVIHALLSFVHGGSAFESEETAGLASLTSSLLKKGTETKTASEIAELLDFVGADISASCSADTASVSLEILSEYTDLGLDLFAEIITRPLFEEQEIARIKQQVLSSILGNKDKYDSYAMQMLYEYVYKNHPYHRPVEGYEKTIPALSRKDITGFHKTHYIPNDAILVVVGDFEADVMTQKIKTIFASWKPGQGSFSEPGEVKPVSGRNVILIDKDVSQTTLCIGYPGFKRENPDFYPVLLLNQILGGGGLTSRVGRKVRTEMGLAYSVYTYFSSRRAGGSFVAFAQTRNENAHLSIGAILDEMKRIKEKSVEVQELKAAKDYYNGSFPLRFETNSDFAFTLFFIEMYGMGLSYFNDYLKFMNDTTIVDIRNMAQKYMKTEDYIIVAVTKADEVMEQFKEFGDVEVIKE